MKKTVSVQQNIFTVKLKSGNKTNNDFKTCYYLSKRNQFSLVLLHSIMVTKTDWSTSFCTGVLAFRQHSRTARHSYTSVTHSMNF